MQLQMRTNPLVIPSSRYRSIHPSLACKLKFLPHNATQLDMSALFNFHSFLTVVLLVISTCTFLNMHFPSILQHKYGVRGFFWKAARIGERLSPWVAAGCFSMGVSILFF